MNSGHACGFTLIELSIVLVIIGLIVGGILVGQDLIKAAEVRAQISQIEKYNSAVNTFRGKFGGIPGDLALSTAQQFGFDITACGGGQGARDGNGLVEELGGHYYPTGGEALAFWEDISGPMAGSLIEGTFPINQTTVTGCSYAGPLNTTPGSTYVGDFLPVAKIGHGNFVYVYDLSGYNWFGLSAVSSVNGASWLMSITTIPVFQAYNIDKKVDDGLPTTGSVQAAYINNSSTLISQAPSAAADSTSTCYNTTNNAYSISSLANYGAGGNCALSFRFQ